MIKFKKSDFIVTAQILCLILVMTPLLSQRLDLQGTNSTDTVAKIRVNYTGNTNVVGLSVYSRPASTRGIGGYFYGGNRGVVGQSTDRIGVIGISTNGRGVLGISTSGKAVEGNSTNDTGIYGSSQKSVGVWGFSPVSVGVIGTSETGDGILGSSSGGIGVLGEGKTFDFYASGSGTNYGATSSVRWKTNITPIPHPLDKISVLRGVYFDWDKEHGGSHDLGFIAEEVGQVLPEIVVFEENGVDATGMDYSKMTPLLVEAANAMRAEYQQKFDEQAQEIEMLRQELASLREMMQNQTESRVIPSK
jgi:hypothetical protein